MRKSETPLGRPREFDVDAVLHAAMYQFWERGYHATSLTDLTTATGLHRGSLYGAFGEKHRLFLTALQHYSHLSLAALDAALQAETSPLASIRHYLLGQAAQATAGRGCLIANTTLELLPGDQEVAAVIATHQRGVEDRLAVALEQARVMGELSGKRSTQVLAHYLLTIAQGLWELGRTTSDQERLTEVIDASLDGLSG
ncbi:MAG: TetR/AcrR family transcriptional regulator [Ktedonobacteraceae bacterium]|nr:TetR/AcrR family transcriptional regulator [Ktedonobacteraceae bacterium]